MFTHLQTVSGFSMRYGASHPDALAARAAERGMDALALTDRDTVFGAVRFVKACLEHGVRPILGVTLALAPTQPLASAPGRRVPARGGAFVDESAPRVTLLARDRPGWAALCRLVSAAHADPDSRQPILPARFIAARHGGAQHYAHPDLVPILDDTYGVVIWHEQIIAIFVLMTGCDRAFGDVARRALADPDRLHKVEGWFRQGAAVRGYATTVVDEVWGIVKEFGAYGFCRAHAVAFAVPAVQSAWLKRHHPAALYAGLLEHDPGMWPRQVIVADARRHGVPVLPVDVNASRPRYSVEQTATGWGVRMALSAVKGASEEEVQRLADAQPYHGLQDLWQRARPSLPLAQRLISIGALGELAGEASRRDLLPWWRRRPRRCRPSRGATCAVRPGASVPPGA